MLYIQIKYSRMIYLREESNRLMADLRKAIQTRRDLIVTGRLIENERHLQDLSKILIEGEHNRPNYVSTFSTVSNDKPKTKMQDDINIVEEHLRVCCTNHNSSVSNYKKYRNSIPNVFLAKLFKIEDDIKYYDPDADDYSKDILESINKCYGTLAEAITRKINHQSTGKELINK